MLYHFFHGSYYKRLLIFGWRNVFFFFTDSVNFLAGPNRSCCNGQYCCGEEYFNQLKQLPCVNDQGCKDMGYGNYCCPDKSGANETLPSICCNQDPNPPPPTTTTTTTTTLPPPRASKVNSSSSLSSSILPAFLLIFLVSLRQ